jgi:hypothetical protein
VLRTLRVLGHLRADGSVITAEQALLANCLRLGLPRRRAGQLHRAVDRLLRNRVLDRIDGSIDPDGIPYHPPLPDRPRAALLRFQPATETLEGRRPGPATIDRHRKAHTVQGFVRRLPSGAEPSDEQLERYADAVREARIVAGPLPPGHTYVQPHRRKS